MLSIYFYLKLYFSSSFYYSNFQEHLFLSCAVLIIFLHSLLHKLFVILWNKLVTKLIIANLSSKPPPTNTPSFNTLPLANFASTSQLSQLLLSLPRLTTYEDSIRCSTIGFACAQKFCYFLNTRHNKMLSSTLAYLW